MRNTESIRVYRRLIRSARRFPVAPIKRKLMFNIREMFQFHRGEPSPEKITKLHGDGEAALRVLGWIRKLPQEDFAAVFKNFKGAR